MTPLPTVSVIIPAWGLPDLVLETLDSLLAQGFRNWEAIVIDDGDDRIGPAVAGYVDADPRIRFIASGHAGLPSARNIAIAAARAPLIALLDGDDLYLPGYLERMVAEISADPAIGLVTCDAIFTGATTRAGQLFSAYMPQDGEATVDAILARRFNIFIAAIMRREALDQAGGFDAALPAAEDLDCWIRVAEQGWKIGRVAEPLALYRRRPGSLSSATRKLRLATATAYDKAAQRLADRPEGLRAAAMAALMREQADWVEGEDLVISGQTRAGLALLRRSHAQQRSPRWRLMMRLFTAAPALARPLLAWRRRQEMAEG